jgi:rhodanese-related sulfurtransferase
MTVNVDLDYTDDKAGLRIMLHDLTPHELYDGLMAGRVVLVDVREVHEFEEARIEGSINKPLSSFDPSDLPIISESQTLVLSCAGGVRSAKAAHLSMTATLPVQYHLAGGIKAWMNAGLPII